MRAYLGIDAGSVSTKGVMTDGNKRIIVRSYLWAEGGSSGAVRRAVDELKGQIDLDGVHMMSVGTAESARRLVGAVFTAQVVKNEVTAHAVDATFLHPDVATKSRSINDGRSKVDRQSLRPGTPVIGLKYGVRRFRSGSSPSRPCCTNPAR